MRTIFVATIALVLALVLSVTVGSTLAPGDSDPDRIVVDRIGDGYAVLLVENGGETDEQQVVDPTTLPVNARYEGAILEAEEVGYSYDRQTTEARERALSRWFDALSEPI